MSRFVVRFMKTCSAGKRAERREVCQGSWKLTLRNEGQATELAKRKILRSQALHHCVASRRRIQVSEADFSVLRIPHTSQAAIAPSDRRQAGQDFRPPLCWRYGPR